LATKAVTEELNRKGTGKKSINVGDDQESAPVDHPENKTKTDETE